MKRFLLAAVLSVGAFALAGGQASAFPLRCKCYNKCCTFCVKPYNAFSPVCCGTLFCDGCCPQFGLPGQPGQKQQREQQRQRIAAVSFLASIFHLLQSLIQRGERHSAQSLLFFFWDQYAIVHWSHPFL